MVGGRVIFALLYREDARNQRGELHNGSKLEGGKAREGSLGCQLAHFQVRTWTSRKLGTAGSKGEGDV